ncbi:MAG: 1-(5-phosphoribosyl)-5-[(5-phosphoribosylamino)methylideneamino]imidazole-4-carboxamide isomerase [Bulleidia sp.]
MIILPAIDLYEGKGVRLTQGDYSRMTVYLNDPVSGAEQMAADGAEWIHLVDLEGAKAGKPCNQETIRAIRERTNLKIEVGGGIRSHEVIQNYLSGGIDRVILGTKALEDDDFLQEAAQQFGSHIAVGADVRDGMIATHGWLKTTGTGLNEFLDHLEQIGISAVIVTDISKDGAMQGTNRSLYESLSSRKNLNVIASGGISSLEDLQALKQMNLYGAILGRAMYTGAVNLKEALALGKEDA